MNRLINGREEIATSTTEIERPIKDYHEQLNVNELGNLKEIDKISKTYNLLRLNQEEIKNVTRPKISCGD
jgi:hypothetical protein